MASFLQITLDTLAPQGVSLQINDGSQYTTNTGVTLAIDTTDSVTAGYQMLIWGISGATTEAQATWETFAKTKNVTLPSGDGLKNVYIKIRDDVHNTTSAVSAQITLDTAVPAVTITGPDVARISKVSPKNVAAFSFTSSQDFVEYKVKVVPSGSSIESAGTVIPTTGGSTNMTGTGSFSSGTAVNCTIYGADLESASAGDGQKTIKVFVKSASGTWSVA